MIICGKCRVELENDMMYCPLCGTPVIRNGKPQLPGLTQQQLFPYRQQMDQPQKKIVWEIISIILLSGIIATFLINFIINKGITWSEYPIAISLVIFSYISLFAFWRRRTIIQMAAGFVLSSIFLVILDAITGDIKWSVKLGIPLLLATNLIIAMLILVIRRSKYQGINLIAYAFLGAALLCMCIEVILSSYKTGAFHLMWSIIVTGCIIPVVLVLLFVHFRLKKGRSLEKTFHI